MVGKAWLIMESIGDIFWLWDETVATTGIPMDSINRQRDNNLMGFIGGFTSWNSHGSGELPSRLWGTRTTVALHIATWNLKTFVRLGTLDPCISLLFPDETCFFQMKQLWVCLHMGICIIFCNFGGEDMARWYSQPWDGGWWAQLSHLWCCAVSQVFAVKMWPTTMWRLGWECHFGSQLSLFWADTSQIKQPKMLIKVMPRLEKWVWQVSTQQPATSCQGRYLRHLLTSCRL